MQLQRARVWVTGASSGIGAALVPVLARRGARVAVSARRRDLLESLAEGWRRAGIEILVAPVNVTDREAVIQAVRGIERAWGGIDLAVLNAGAHTPPSSRGFDTSQFVDAMTLNYFGALYGIEAVLPGMIERGRGHLAGVASLAGYRGLPTAAAYGASKAALIHALESLRFDLEPLGIAVTVVNPGYVRTPLTDRNRFRMPFLMDVGPAVEIIADGLERDRKEIHFPRVFSTMLKVARMLPFPLYEAIVKRATVGQRRARGSAVRR
jgi:NAD(P)-dependent dehydrogenase (short-subunit alcohol dehydrogenase family)